MTDYKFVDNIEELVNSVAEFYSKPNLWKDAVGNAPKYFLHINHNGTHKFGLSKFCAFKNITLEDYIQGFRHKTDGGKTQKHIVNCTGKKWIPLIKIPNNIKGEFSIWISRFYPSYNQKNASIITIS